MLLLVGLSKDIPITFGSQLYPVDCAEQRLETLAVLTLSFRMDKRHEREEKQKEMIRRIGERVRHPGKEWDS